jgi:hypothetical protein
MNMLVRTGIGLVIVSSVVGGVPAAAEQTSTQAVLTVAANGTFARGGEFRGTISINRFERSRDDPNKIVAIGVVAGVLSRGSNTIGTTVHGEVAWPVRVTSGGVSVVSGRAPAPRGGMFTRVAWSPESPPAVTLSRV